MTNMGQENIKKIRTILYIIISISIFNGQLANNSLNEEKIKNNVMYHLT